MSDSDVPNREEILRAITYIYTDEQIEEIHQQLPLNLKVCIERIHDIEQQLGQYETLAQNLEQKIQKSDYLISQKAIKNDNSDYNPRPLEVNCHSITGRRSTNEDEEIATIIRIEQKPRFQFLAVFDGHGALQEAIIQLDQVYCDLESEKGQVGATAGCVLIDLKREVLAMANTGDARVVVQLSTGLFYQTTDHKPGSPDEQRRLKENFNSEVQEYGGVARVNGQLAVSRAIGDIDFKIFGVVSMPQIYEELDLRDVEFLIIACDGLWDVISSEQAVQIVRFCLGTLLTVDPDTEILAKAAKYYFDGRQDLGDDLLNSFSHEKVTSMPQLDINKEDTAGRLSQILVRIAYLLESQDNITCIVAINPE